MDEDVGFFWCVLQVRSGFEDRVCSHVMESVEFKEFVLEAFIPSQAVPGSAGVKRGRKAGVGKRVYAGYVFIKLNSDVDACQKVLSVPNVLRFLMRGDELKVVDQKQIDDIKNSVTKEEEIKTGIVVGDVVEIVGGPFETFGGIVQKVGHDSRDGDQSFLVAITIFGRPHSVRIDSGKLLKVDSTGGGQD